MKLCEYKGPKCETVAVHWNASEKPEYRGMFCRICYKAIQKKRMGNNWKHCHRRTHVSV